MRHALGRPAMASGCAPTTRKVMSAEKSCSYSETLIRDGNSATEFRSPGRKILGTRIGRSRGLAVFSPGGEQQHLAIYRGDVDVENLGVVLHFVEAGAVRIGLRGRPGSQQLAQILDRFRGMIPQVFNDGPLGQPQYHGSSLSDPCHCFRLLN